MIGKSERRMVRLAHVVLIVFSLMAVLPFILLISSSLTEENAALKYGFSFVPRVFSLAAYKYISYQSKMIIRAYGITIFTTVVGTSVGLTMTSMLGYGLSKEIPGRRILNFFVVFTMLFNGGLVPTYLVYTEIPAPEQYHLGADYPVSSDECVPCHAGSELFFYQHSGIPYRECETGRSQ
ncbi:MAG: hypothetical protein ACLR2E_14135 [Lachnospiraceae bacterium]